MNIRDTEIMAQTLSEHGYRESTAIEGVSLVILNTCSIRAKAEQKVFSLLGALRPNKKQNPEMQICVAGCVAQQEGKKIIERMPHVDLVIGTQHIYNLPHLLAEASNNKTAINLADDYEIPRFVPSPVVPSDEHDIHDSRLEFQHNHLEFQHNHLEFQHSRFVTIMQGCNNFCTYCVVPYTRGREVSRKVIDIIDEIKVLADSGVSEITLLGQNVNSYGRANSVTDNTSPYSFADLLHNVALIDGLKRLRFTTSNPKDLSDELISCFSEIDILCPQFHLPVQSGSDKILQSMNRKYSISNYLEKVEKLRNCCPEIALSTDIIVGFPGETDEDFQSTMDLLDTVRYSGSFSFKYSDRPGTRAQDLAPKVPEEIKSERLQRFQKRQDQLSQEINSGYVGKMLPILVERVNGNSVSGRSATNHIVHIETAGSQHKLKPGQYLEVQVSFAGQHSLKAVLVC